MRFCILFLTVSGCSLAAPTNDGGLSSGWHGMPFAERVVSFMLGENAGFGQDQFPDIVLGPPVGAGANGGSLDVLSLGYQGTVVLQMGVEIIDGPGPDLLVFENPFIGNPETGFVAVSDDGVTWAEWPCQPDDATGHFPGCAGVQPVLSSSTNGISPTDPTVAGGDAFDLLDLGVTRARFVRVRDSGKNTNTAPSSGFDLDAVAAAHFTPSADP